LADRIDLLLDAGPTQGGLESTVLDVTTEPPRLLRPGLVTTTELEAILGSIARPGPPTAESEPLLRSPGQLHRHYAPRTRLEVVAGSLSRVQQLCQQGLRVGWLTHQTGETMAATTVLRITLPVDSVSYSSQLYAALHQLDGAGLDCIIVEKPPS